MNFIHFFQQIWYWCLPRHSQTPSRHHPNTLRHHPDPSRPPDIDVLALESTGRKGNIRVWPNRNFDNGFGIATSWDLLGPQTHSRHIPDTPRHNPDYPGYGNFLQYRALEEKAISEFHDLLYYFLKWFGIHTSQTPWETILTPYRHRPDTN